MRRCFLPASLVGLMLLLSSNPAQSQGKKKGGGPKSNDGVVLNWGVPKGFAPGKVNAYWIWYDDGIWHLRTTGGGKGAHRFNGRIDVLGGRLIGLKGKKGEYGGKFVDQFVFNPTGTAIAFDFKSNERVDGLNFAVDAAATRLKFTLALDGQAAPKHIRIGKLGDHPADAVFTVPAHPADPPDGKAKGKKKKQVRVPWCDMSAAPKRNLVSVEEYLAGELVSPIKHEYVAGVVYALAGGQNAHHLIASNTLVALGSRLRGKRCWAHNSDTKIRLRLPTQVRFYYPDVSVICRPNPQTDSFQDEPAVLFEVLSNRTRRIDEGEKKDAYLTIPSLCAYVLIEQETAAVRVFRRTENGFVREVYVGLDAVVPLGEIDIELALADVFEAVEFKPEEREDERA